MKKLMVSLGLLLSFSASAVDFYECKARMENLSNGQVISVDRYISNVIVSNEVVLYSSAPGAPFEECEVTNKREGQYINEYKKCFFDENMRTMFFVEGLNVFDLHSCKKTH